jgi:hypothetical protein
VSPNTVMVKLQEATLPKLSLTVQVTRFVPTGNGNPGGGDIVTFVIVPMHELETTGGG